jgi:hypothetical protein
MTIRDDNFLPVRRTAFPFSKRQIIEGMVFSDENLNPSTLLIHRTAFDEVGVFDPKLPTAEDRQWLLRYLTRFDIVVIDKPLTNYTQHSGPTLTGNFNAMLDGERQFAAFVSRHTGDLGVSHRRAMAYRFAKLGNEYMLARHWLQGLRHFLKALLRDPREYRAWAGLALAIFGPQAYLRVIAKRMPRVRLAAGRN